MFISKYWKFKIWNLDFANPEFSKFDKYNLGFPNILLNFQYLASQEKAEFRNLEFSIFGKPNILNSET